MVNGSAFNKQEGILQATEFLPSISESSLADGLQAYCQVGFPEYNQAFLDKLFPTISENWQVERFHACLIHNTSVSLRLRASKYIRPHRAGHT